MDNKIEVMAKAFEYFLVTDDVSNETKMERLYRYWLSITPEERKIMDGIFIEICGYSFQTIIDEGDKGGDLLQNVI